jgi:hypothetical protein
MKPYMFRTSSSVHHQELFTVHSAIVYLIQVCRQLSNSSRMELILILLLDGGQRDCPKHVGFHVQNKFEKLVYLVGFIIRKFVTMHGHIDVKYKCSDFKRGHPAVSEIK